MAERDQPDSQERTASPPVCGSYILDNYLLPGRAVVPSVPAAPLHKVTQKDRLRRLCSFSQVDEKDEMSGLHSALTCLVGVGENSILVRRKK